jgi:hypothetical protein
MPPLPDEVFMIQCRNPHMQRVSALDHENPLAAGAGVRRV